MKERPILFSAPMIRAILDGRKTMTRRVVKPQPVHTHGSHAHGGGFYFSYKGKSLGHADFVDYCPFGQPGDKLWVRETWSLEFSGGNSIHGLGYANYDITYAAGGPVKEIKHSGQMEKDPYVRMYDTQRGKWRPSIHMPRWASRLTLLVKAIRVERLQDITGKDAAKEGMELARWKTGMYPAQDPGMEIDNMMLVNEFRSLWQSLNAKCPGCSWEANPFVWVVEFETIKGGAA